MTLKDPALDRRQLQTPCTSRRAIPLALLLIPGLCDAGSMAGRSTNLSVTRSKTHLIDSHTDPSGAELQEVVVTAERRTQTAITTPMSISALNGNQLAARQVDSVQDLQFIAPDVRDGITNGDNRLFIRGIGLNSFQFGADPSVAYYVDDVYVGRPDFQLNSFFDVDRVEVLRGPQGTLFGRNSIGGALRVFSNQPTAKTTGYIDYTIGNYQLNKVQGAVSGSLNRDDTLLGRFAFRIKNHAGYGHDVAQNQDINNDNEQAFRTTVEWIPFDWFNISAIGEYFNERDDNYFNMSFGAYPGYALTGTEGASNPANGGIPAGITVNARNSWNVATDIKGPTNIRREFAGTLLAHVQLSDAWRLESVTGWRWTNESAQSEADDTSAGLGISHRIQRANQTSQEFDLSYSAEPWKAVTGVYYYHEFLNGYLYVPFPQFGPDAVFKNVGTMPIDAYAAFGQVTYSITRKVSLTLGGRYSSERRSSLGAFTGVLKPAVPIDQSKRWSDFTPAGEVEYRFAPQTLAYFSITQGFQSGTFNIGEVNPAINPETLTAYELGLKSRFLHNRVEATGAMFYYDFTNLQVNKIIGIATLTTNAAASIVKGIEGTISALVTNRLRLDGNVGLLRPVFTTFCSINPITSAGIGQPQCPDGQGQNLAGNYLPGAPKVSANAGIEYTEPLRGGSTLMGRVEGNYVSRVYFSEFNYPALSQAGVTKINASLRYDSVSGRWYLTAWGKNVTDRRVITNMTAGPATWGYGIYGALDPPATYGVTFGLKLF
jgi:iron complex outermembrane recepter protein